MKKDILLMAAALMGAAQGIDDPFATRGGILKPEPKISRENKKKCKSCKHIRKYGHYDCRCDINGYTHPNDIACSHYTKRKKK